MAEKTSDTGAVVLQDGLAHVCSVWGTTSKVRVRIEMEVPRKGRGNDAQREVCLARFYNAVCRAMLRYFDLSVIKCIIIASPGSVKDHFFNYVFAEAKRLNQRRLLESRDKFLLVPAGSGHKYHLNELLEDPHLPGLVANVKASENVAALELFSKTMMNHPDRAYYGIKHVEYAAIHGAVSLLLVTDTLIRSPNKATRKRYSQLADSVRDCKGDIKIFSSAHESCQELEELTGVAAILRFTLPELQDVEEGDGVTEDTAYDVYAN